MAINLHNCKYGGITLVKKVVLAMFIFIALLGGVVLLNYYSLPEYTLGTETGTLTRNGITYKLSDELLKKYINNEIKPVEKPIGRLKGDNPLWAKTFIYKLDGISVEEGFMTTYPEMNFDFYEKASK
jgi:hypothetical protein